MYIINIGMINAQAQNIFKTSRFAANMLSTYHFIKPVNKPIWIKNQIQMLGPTYVKLGQFVSSRKDMIDDKEMVEALKSLQDAVDPVPWEYIEESIKDISSEFKSICQKPIASASIGQVYKGILNDGSIVAIKIKRPGVEQQILSDMYVLGLWVSLLSKIVGPENDKVVDAKKVLADVTNSIIMETDFVNEVKNMMSMYKLSKSTNKIKVPKVYTELCNSNVIVMEFMESTKFSNVKDPRVAYFIMDVFVQQFLQHGIIHGDPHEGNVALSIDKSALVMYDFGHVVYLEERVRSLMKLLVFEIMTENVDGVLEIINEMPDIIEIRDLKNTTAAKNYIK